MNYKQKFLSNFLRFMKYLKYKKNGFFLRQKAKVLAIFYFLVKFWRFLAKSPVEIVANSVLISRQKIRHVAIFFWRNLENPQIWRFANANWRKKHPY